MKRNTLGIVTAVLVMAMSSMAMATVPPMMNYQGILTDAAGNPVPDAAYSVTFAIFNSATSAAVRWSETQTVTTANGLFTTILGSVVPIPDTAVMDTASYLETTVAADPPLVPRIRLTSNAYSLVSSSVLGAGPILIEHDDVASGTLSSFSLDVKPSGAAKKVRKKVDVSTPSLDEFLEFEEVMGLSDAAKSAVAIPAFMKNARKAKTAEAAESRESLDIDSGFVHSINIELPGDTLEMLDIASASGTSAAVAIPAFMKNARKAKTAEATTSREYLDIDSGYAHIIRFTTPTDTTESIDMINPPVGALGAAVAIPAFMKNARKAKTAEAVTNVRKMFDPDSGYAYTVLISQGAKKFESRDFLAAPPVGAIAIPNLLESRKGSNSATGDTVELRTVLDTDSGVAMTASLRDANLLSAVEHSATQTREHVLLARQVGVPALGGFEHSLELTTANAGPDLALTKAGTAADPQDDGVVILTASLPGGAAMSMESSKGDDLSSFTASGEHADGARTLLQRVNGSDTSEIETSTDDSQQSITMSTSSSAAPKWPNITLKRGLTATEMTLSHLAAGSTSVIKGIVDGAGGARLGINTSTPSMALQIVGSGCYTGTFGVCSDRRYKKDIATLEDPLDVISRLRGVNFEWRRSDYPEQEFPDGKQVGFIAQEVEDVVPGVVATDANGYKSVDYAKLVPILLEAVKAQQRQIEELKARMMQ